VFRAIEFHCREFASSEAGVDLRGIGIGDRVKLKSLELHGFKSFVDKTALVFEPGITAVVGPNGCGKSNVVDAMRWAMGEQSPRRLRGKGMEDVIFQGSEGRAQVGMAEVVLKFDNTDGDGPPAFSAYREIQITRRLYRSGESEYLLNKTPCRLRDVHDFFRDTGIGTKGYTIVEQGRIAEIVSAKPEERRILIEEAAGIGKYKARRREAESKIASTEQNLLRISDVLAEIRRQISSIDRQAKKAARYKRLRETLRVLELSLAADERRDHAQKIEMATAGLVELRGEVSTLEATLEQQELTVQRKRLELAESERLLSHGNESLLALRTDIKHNEGKIEFGRRERATLAETITARQAELERLVEQLGSQQSESDEAQAELEAIEGAVESGREGVASSESEASEARGKAQELERERDGSNARLVEILTQIARTEDRLSTGADRSAEIDARIRSADEVMEVSQAESTRADTEQRDLEQGVRNLLGERDRFMGLVKRALETVEKATSGARVASEKMRETRELRETRKARLESLRELVEQRDDVGAAARHLLSRDSQQRHALGIRGLVRDLLEVDRDAVVAVEAVLADRAEAVIVDRPSHAISAIELLRTAEAGRGIIVSLPQRGDVPTGFVPLGQPLLDFVRLAPGGEHGDGDHQGMEAMLRNLLAGVNLVDDLREVVAVYGGGQIPATFVTRDGDLLSSDGVIRGGGARGSTGSGVLARTGEIRELAIEVETLDAAVEAAHAENDRVQTQLVEATNELDNLRNRHHTAALAVANHEKDIERNRERVKAFGEVQEGRLAERSDNLAEVESLEVEHARLEQILSDGRDERAQHQRDLDSLVLRVGSAGRELNRLETIATERRVEHAGRSEKRDRLRLTQQRALQAVAETRDWIGRREQEIADANTRRAELAGSVTEAEAGLERLLREEEGARSTNEAKRDAYEQISADLNAVDDAGRQTRGEISDRRDRVAQAELSTREFELRMTHLDESIREKWQVELATWTPPSVDPEPVVPADPPEADAASQDEPAEHETATDGLSSGLSSPAAEADDEEPSQDVIRDARANAELTLLSVAERTTKLEDVRNKIHSLGEVNLGAIEEHEELSERSRFLTEQKSDLDNTLESLRDAISRINRTSRSRFKEAFEAISKHFSENFPRLFSGGKASLSLTESEDVLEAGIEIMAMPPGKRLQNVNLLSGGEKTLTALALLVAVFQVRPSPFFLLDEVDAALDDANVGRFNDLITELSGQSQFVIITHNKRTIEVADVLYGVTMERKGVSKLVAVNLT
jgi:chromosome segregation protein